MWSGPPQWTQWALNPSAYQDMSNEEVDWARLAQQWIRMKDVPAPDTPTPEKPPLVEEGGEAPMDIGKDEDNEIDPTIAAVPQSGGAGAWNNTGVWNSGWQQWGGWGASTPGTVWPPGTQQHGGPLLPTPALSKNGNDVAAHFPYHTTAQAYDFNNSTAGRQAGMAPGETFTQGPGNYWEGAAAGMIPQAVAHQMPFIRHGQGRPPRWDGKDKTRPGDAPISEEDEEVEPVIDAAKRRTLPVWIREGLEKMEREKQRKQERERLEEEREAMLKLRRKEEEAALSELQAEKSGLPPKSKFDTDSEGSDHEDTGIPLAPPVNVTQPPEPPRRKSRFHQGPENNSNAIPVRATKLPPTPVVLTKEEMMLMVRRIMTQVLLEVTNEEILAVAKEEVAKARRKAPAKQPTMKNPLALASITGKLGLAMYGSDDSENSASENSEGEGHGDGQDSGDSDTQLKKEIHRRQQNFQEKEREIRALAAEAEEREKRGEGGGEGSRRRDSTVEGGDIHRDITGEHQSHRGAIEERQVESESVQRSSNAHDGEGKNPTSCEDEKTINSTDKKLDKEEKSYKSKPEKKKSDRKRSSSTSDSSSESSSSSRDSRKKYKRKKRKERRRSKERDKDKKHRDRTESRSPRRDREDKRDKKRRDRSTSRSRRSKEREKRREDSPQRSKDRDERRRRDRSNSERRSRRSLDRKDKHIIRRRSHSSDSDRRRRKRRSRSRSTSSRRHRKHRRSSSRSSSSSDRRNSRRNSRR